MPLSKDQISSLLALVAGSTEDDMSCDGCFAHIAQFVEAELQSVPLDESMLKVQNHMINCPCCKDEYNALLEAMNTMNEA